MDKELRNLKAYARSDAKQEQTFKRLKELTQSEKKKERWKLVSTYMSAAALLFLLIASFLSNPSPAITTAAGEKELKAVEFFAFEPSPWYNLNNLRLNRNDLPVLSNFIIRLETEDVSASIDWDKFHTVLYLLAIYDDGTFEQLQFVHPSDERDETVYVWNYQTGKAIAITKNEYLQIVDSYYSIKEQPLWKKISRGIALFVLFTIYLAAVKRINPHLRTKYFFAPSALKFSMRFMLFCLLIIGVNFISHLFSGYPNILLAWIIIGAVTIFRALAENFRGEEHRSWWEVPVTIFVYCLGFAIMYV